jgi:hypothetical protein
MRRLAWQVIAALMAAALPCAAGGTYKPDTGLVKLWEEVKDNEPCPSPYMAVYRDGKKELRFIAASHGADPATFSLVRAAFAQPPGVLIVEGQSSADGFSPRRVIETMDNEGLYARSEGYYAINLALRNGARFIGGEPSDKQMLAAVLAAGFSVKDFQGYETLHGMVGGPGYIGNFTPDFENLKAHFKRKYGVADNAPLMLNEAEFRSWYAEKYGKEFKKEDLPGYQGRRFIGAEGGLDNRISDIQIKLRDANLAQVAADMLNANDKVLIVYGAGHRMELSVVLENMLGKPEIIRPEIPGGAGDFRPLTESEITGGNFQGHPGRVLQSRKSGCDIHVEKRGPQFCVTTYRFGLVFGKDSLLKGSCFATIEETNKYIASFY